MLEAANCIRWVAQDSSGGAAGGFFLLPIAVTSQNCSVHKALCSSGCCVATRNNYPMSLREGMCSTWLQEQVFYCDRSIVLFLLAKRMLRINADSSSICNTALRRTKFLF